MSLLKAAEFLLHIFFPCTPSTAKEIAVENLIDFRASFHMDACSACPSEAWENKVGG